LGYTQSLFVDSFATKELAYLLLNLELVCGGLDDNVFASFCLIDDIGHLH